MKVKVMTTLSKFPNFYHRHLISSSNITLDCKSPTRSLPSTIIDLVDSPHIGYRYTKKELEAFLIFSDKYDCDMMKQFVASSIEAANWRFHSIELMNLATTFQLPDLFQMEF